MLVRPRKPLSAEAVLRGDRVDRDDFAAEYGADERDLDAVRRFAERAGLEVRAVDPVRRTVVVAGTAATLARAFGTELRYYDFPAGRVRGRTGGPDGADRGSGTSCRVSSVWTTGGRHGRTL